MDILLAGPGTGKTTKVKSIIKENYSQKDNILVLSFTNATVNDLREDFKGYKNVKCFTLHSYALKINHLPQLHVLSDNNEIIAIKYYADKLKISISEMCSMVDCITFDDMIYKCVDFLDNNPAYAIEKIGNLDLLIVDEFQDFNEKERNLISIISNYAVHTLILGDDDQSIYEFKDADPNSIIDLYNLDNITRLNHHNICYRCPDKIIECCANLIKKNVNRVPKEWHKSGKKGEIHYRQCLSQETTFNLIVDTIQQIKGQDPKGTFLILSPVRFYIEELIEKIDSRKLSYINLWVDPLQKEDLVKIWWLKTIFTSNKLPFLLFLCKEYNLWDKSKFKKLFLNSFQKSFEKTKLVEEIIKLNYLPETLALAIINKITLDEFLTLHLEFVYFRDYIDIDNFESSIEGIDQKVKPVIQFQKKSINLMSIHKSKGLQADYVFIYGLNEGVLPNEIKGLDTIEAQRRLLFVGMTRALKQLFLLSTVEWDGKYIRRVDKTQFQYHYQKKKYYGKASRFISELK